MQSFDCVSKEMRKAVIPLKLPSPLNAGPSFKPFRRSIKPLGRSCACIRNRLAVIWNGLCYIMDTFMKIDNTKGSVLTFIVKQAAGETASYCFCFDL